MKVLKFLDPTGLNRVKIEHFILLSLCALFFFLPLGTSPAAICGGIGIGLWLFSGHFYKKSGVYLKQSWIWPILLLILLPWIGLLYTPDVPLGIKYALKTHYWLLSLVLASLSFTIYSFELLIKIFLGGLFLNAIAALSQLLGYLSAGLKEGGAVSSIRIFKYHNKFTGMSGYTTLPILLVLGILMSSYYFGKSHSRKWKVFTLFLMALFIGHLAMLESRGGYLLFILATPIIASNLIKFKRGNVIKIGIVTLLLIPLIFTSPIVRKESKKLLKSIRYYVQQDSEHAWGRRYAGQQDRFYMWYGAIDIFLDNPITGTGTGGYLKTMQSRENPQWPANPLYHPHNNFLHMAVSNGLVGIIALAWFFWVILKNGWKWRRTPTGFFVMAGGLVMFIGGLTDTRILNAGSITLMSLTAGLQRPLVSNEN